MDFSSRIAEENMAYTVFRVMMVLPFWLWCLSFVFVQTLLAYLELIHTVDLSALSRNKNRNFVRFAVYVKKHTNKRINAY